MQNGLAFSILLVDDDVEDLLIMDEGFREIGCEAEVRKFLSGECLFDYLQSVDASRYPSLIVLDLTLPAMGAEDILTLLKNEPAYEAIPVVIYTSSLSPTKAQQLKEHGAYDCIQKGNTLTEVTVIARKLKEISSGTSEIIDV